MDVFEIFDLEASRPFLLSFGVYCIIAFRRNRIIYIYIYTYMYIYIYTIYIYIERERARAEFLLFCFV